MILPEDVAWVVQSGHYTIHAQQKADVSNRVGVVHGLAVYGENQGALLDLEAVATPGHGEITVTGIIDEEEIGQEGHKMRRRSTAHSAAENVRTLLKSLGYTLENTDLHINFPGGMPVDGPSALLLTFTLTAPSSPFLVVMIITPLAAREPYSAAAAAPFNTDMLSMSSGLISITRLLKVVAVFVMPSVPELPVFTVELS